MIAARIAPRYCRPTGKAIGAQGNSRSGDLNRNGSTSEPGEEFGSPGCGCLLSINKPVNVVSTHGAAVTTIDARSVDLPTNVLINATGGEFG